MKTLPAGTPKFLLLDTEVITRNAERGKRGDPAAVVVEQQEDGGQVRHVGYAVVAAGPVTLGYNQRGILVHNNRLPLHAAYMTDGEVRIAESHAEADQMAEDLAAEKAPSDPSKPLPLAPADVAKAAPTKAPKAATKKDT